MHWPNFLCCLLNNNKARKKYGHKIWKFISIPQRHWYIDNVKYKHPNTFSQVNAKNPEVAFSNITVEILKWKYDTENYSLPRLASVGDKHLYQKVICLFCCLEFQHKSVKIPMDLFFHGYLPRCITDIFSNRKGFEDIVNVCDDYIRFEMD